MDICICIVPLHLDGQIQVQDQLKSSNDRNNIWTKIQPTRLATCLPTYVVSLPMLTILFKFPSAFRNIFVFLYAIFISELSVWHWWCLYCRCRRLSLPRLPHTLTHTHTHMYICIVFVVAPHKRQGKHIKRCYRIKCLKHF